MTRSEVDAVVDRLIALFPWYAPIEGRIRHLLRRAARQDRRDPWVWDGRPNTIRCRVDGVWNHLVSRNPRNPGEVLTEVLTAATSRLTLHRTIRREYWHSWPMEPHWYWRIEARFGECGGFVRHGEASTYEAARRQAQIAARELRAEIKSPDFRAAHVSLWRRSLWDW